MNNFTFGDEGFGYYETIAGGAGAGPGWHGRSGVHTHMTNTRITDPEILERRYPLALHAFQLRKGARAARGCARRLPGLGQSWRCTPCSWQTGSSSGPEVAREMGRLRHRARRSAVAPAALAAPTHPPPAAAAHPARRLGRRRPLLWRRRRGA
jgi:hypothetical protein